MENLEFCDTHNMVAYLKKTEGSEGFHQIVDFLNSSHISNMRRASKGYIGVDIPLFPTMLVQGPVVQGEGSTVPVKSPTQTNVADEAASTGVDVRHGGVATAVTSLDAGQGSGNINKTPSMPHDLPLPRVHTLGSDEHIMQHHELMDFVIKLLDRVVVLDSELQQTKKVYGTAFIKHIKKVKKLEKTIMTTQARKKARIVGRQEHDMEFEFDLDAKEVSTAEEDISTANPVSTAGVAVTTTSVEISTGSPKVKTAGDYVDDIVDESLVYIRRSAAKTKDKGKGIKEESESAMTKIKRQQEQERLGYEAALRLQEQLDKEERQRISRVQEEESSFNIKEWDDIQARVKAGVHQR
ncbi:hypothetical protein Tco_0555997 [Tanacetum coccineum]